MSRKSPARTPARQLKVVRIGNSRGVRIPRQLLSKYRIQETVVVEERSDGLLLHGSNDGRLSWEDTYKQAAKDVDGWSDLDATVGDGIDEDSW